MTRSLVRLLIGDLPADRARAVRDKTDGDRLDRLSRLVEVLPEAAPQPDPLPPGFADRLARRLYAAPDPSASALSALRAAFRPLALGVGVVAAALAVANVALAPDAAPLVDAVLGLPPVSFDALLP